jgi:hypothetical protein
MPHLAPFLASKSQRLLPRYPKANLRWSAAFLVLSWIRAAQTCWAPFASCAGQAACGASGPTWNFRRKCQCSRRGRRPTPALNNPTSCSVTASALKCKLKFASTGVQLTLTRTRSHGFPTSTSTIPCKTDCSELSRFAMHTTNASTERDPVAT